MKGYLGAVSRRGKLVGGPTRHRPHGRGGFTLAEMALAVTILMVALMSISAATLRSHALQRENRDQMLAQNALRSISERVQAVSLDASSNPDTWAEEVFRVFGPGGGIGDEFPVDGLTPVGADTPVGTITIGWDETLGDEDLGGALGMPRDLNGDGDASDDDVSGSAILLPVVVSVRWRGPRGERNASHPFWILGY